MKTCDKCGRHKCTCNSNYKNNYKCVECGQKAHPIEISKNKKINLCYSCSTKYKFREVGQSIKSLDEYRLEFPTNPDIIRSRNNNLTDRDIERIILYNKLRIASIKESAIFVKDLWDSNN